MSNDLAAASIGRSVTMPTYITQVGNKNTQVAHAKVGYAHNPRIQKPEFRSQNLYLPLLRVFYCVKKSVRYQRGLMPTTQHKEKNRFTQRHRDYREHRGV